MISEAKAYQEALRLHPEFADWEQKDFDRAEAKDGVNWSLHLNIDAVVFRRASDASLPDGRVIETLQGKGETEHEAIHKVARLVAEDLWARLKLADDLPDDESLDMPSAADAKLNTMSEELNRKIRALSD